MPREMGLQAGEVEDQAVDSMKSSPLSCDAITTVMQDAGSAGICLADFWSDIWSALGLRHSNIQAVRDLGNVSLGFAFGTVLVNSAYIYRFRQKNGKTLLKIEERKYDLAEFVEGVFWFLSVTNPEIYSVVLAFYANIDSTRIPLDDHDKAKLCILRGELQEDGGLLSRCTEDFPQIIIQGGAMVLKVRAGEEVDSSLCISFGITSAMLFFKVVTSLLRKALHPDVSNKTIEKIADDEKRKCRWCLSFCPLMRVLVQMVVAFGSLAFLWKDGEEPLPPSALALLPNKTVQQAGVLLFVVTYILSLVVTVSFVACQRDYLWHVVPHIEYFSVYVIGACLSPFTLTIADNEIFHSSRLLPLLAVPVIIRCTLMMVLMAWLTLNPQSHLLPEIVSIGVFCLNGVGLLECLTLLRRSDYKREQVPSTISTIEVQQAVEILRSMLLYSKPKEEPKLEPIQGERKPSNVESEIKEQLKDVEKRIATNEKDIEHWCRRNPWLGVAQKFFKEKVHMERLKLLHENQEGIREWPICKEVAQAAINTLSSVTDKIPKLSREQLRVELRDHADYERLWIWPPELRLAKKFLDSAEQRTPIDPTEALLEIMKQEQLEASKVREWPILKKAMEPVEEAVGALETHLPTLDENTCRSRLRDIEKYRAFWTEPVHCASTFLNGTENETMLAHWPYMRSWKICQEAEMKLRNQIFEDMKKIVLGGEGNVQERLQKFEKDLNNQDSKGWTLLMYAALDGKEDSVVALVNLNAKKDLTDNLGQTAAYHARFGGFHALAKYLESDKEIVEPLRQGGILSYLPSLPSPPAWFWSMFAPS